MFGAMITVVSNVETSETSSHFHYWTPPLLPDASEPMSPAAPSSGPPRSDEYAVGSRRCAVEAEGGRRRVPPTLPCPSSSLPPPTHKRADAQPQVREARDEEAEEEPDADEDAAERREALRRLLGGPCAVGAGKAVVAEAARVAFLGVVAAHAVAAAQHLLRALQQTRGQGAGRGRGWPGEVREAGARAPHSSPLLLLLLTPVTLTKGVGHSEGQPAIVLM